MSVIPPTSFILSKMNYYLKEKLPQELYELVLEKISPLYLFNIAVSCRRLNGQNIIEDYDEKQIEEILGEPHITDDADKILFLYKKVMDKMKDRMLDPVCIRVSIQARLDGNGPITEPFVDEFFTGVQEITL